MSGGGGYSSNVQCVTLEARVVWVQPVCGGVAGM